MMNNQTEILADVVTKKSKKGGAVVAAAAAVVVGGAAVSYAAVPAVRNAVKMAVMKPDKYCVSVYQSAVDKFTRELDEKPAVQKENNVSMLISAKLDDEIMEPLRSQMGSELFKEISVGLDGYVDGNDTSGTITLNADDNKVITANVIKSGTDMYVQLPEASSKYLHYTADGDDALSESLTSKDAVTQEELIEFIKKYSQIMVDFIGEGESEIEKGVTDEVEDIAYKYNVITTEMDSECITELWNKIVDEAENDEFIKKVSSLSGNTDEDFKKMIEDSRNEINNYKEDKEYKLMVDTYVDAEGNIRGVSMKEHSGENKGGDMKFEFIEAKENNDMVVKVNAGTDFGVTVSATNDNGSYTGDISAKAEGDDIKISFENITIEDGKFINGNISTDISEQTLALAFERVDDAQKISTKINDFGDISIEIRSFEGEKQEITAPSDKIDIKDSADMDKYMEDVDLEKFLTDIFTALGIDEYYSSMLGEAMLEGALARAGSGGYDSDSYGYDDSYDIPDDDYQYFSF